MPELIIRGATIDNGFRARMKKGQRNVDVDVIADWTDTFCQHFGISTPNDKCGTCDINVELNGVSFMLEPGDAALKDYRFDLSCSLVHKMRYVPRHDRKGNVKERQLHFKVRTGATDGAMYLDNYLSHVGDHAGQMKIVYNEVKQGDLPLEAGKGEETLVSGKKRGRRGAQEKAQELEAEQEPALVQ